MDREDEVENEVRKVIKEELTGDTGKSMYSYAFRLTGDEDLALEASQSACMHLLYPGDPVIDDPVRLRRYIMQVVLNEVRTLIRSRKIRTKHRDDCQKKTKPPPEMVTRGTSDPVEQAIQKEQIEKFAVHLKQLRDDDRALLIRRYVDRDSYATIALDLGVSAGTVKNKIRAIVANLQKTMWPEGDK